MSVGGAARGPGSPPATIDGVGLASLLTGPVAFGEAVDMTGRTIRGPVVLAGRRLASVDFSGALFEGPASFRGATFLGLSWFRGCVFAAGADFSGAAFGNDARFDTAVFGRSADFRRIEALGAADFSGARFEESALFDQSTFSGCLSFAAADFRQDVGLSRAQCLGGLWLDGMAGAPRIDAKGLDIHGRLSLRNLPRRVSERVSRSANCYGYAWS
jgi:hypothetical protein